MQNVIAKIIEDLMRQQGHPVGMFEGGKPPNASDVAELPNRFVSPEVIRELFLRLGSPEPNINSAKNDVPNLPVYLKGERVDFQNQKPMTKVGAGISFGPADLEAALRMIDKMRTYSAKVSTGGDGKPSAFLEGSYTPPAYQHQRPQTSVMGGINIPFNKGGKV